MCPLYSVRMPVSTYMLNEVAVLSYFLDKDIDMAISLSKK
jgi:hypothetical protein